MRQINIREKYSKAPRFLPLGLYAGSEVTNLVAMKIYVPSTYQLFGDFLAITWDDDHESLLSLKMLREACPCAHCRGEPDLLGRILMPAQQDEHTNASFQVVNITPVGQYGIQFTWGDSHYTGIYTFEHLRRLCDCDVCHRKNEPARP